MNSQPSFQTWLDSLFGQEVKKWSDELEDGVIAPKSPSLQIEYLTCIFSYPKESFTPYSADQVGQGLNYLLNSYDKMIAAVFDDSVPWSERQQCLNSIFTLFKDFFASKCEPNQKHYAGSKELDFICYMWWDIFPTWGTSNPDFNRTCLAVMEQTLYLKSWACCESAIHGLNHWCHNHKEEVNAIINRFLKARKNIPSSVQQHAIWAKNGSMQ